jgi:predicted RNase H-like HicB family nuclease
MKSLRVPLRAVFYQDEGDWIAHCLEFDLCGDGQTKEEAGACLEEAVSLQVRDSLEHHNLGNLFSPADGEFFRMFAAGKDIAMGQLHVDFEGFTIGRTEAREYSEDRVSSDRELVATS